MCLSQEGSQKNICPLTKQPIQKRDLVLLTWDNIEEYRSKIVNWSEQIKLLIAKSWQDLGNDLVSH